jgi:hypothetical protein
VCEIVPQPESIVNVDRRVADNSRTRRYPIVSSHSRIAGFGKISRIKGDRMKRLIVAVLSIAAAGVSLQAEDHYLKANIPFGFRAGQTVMPAGEYVIEENGPWLVVREASGKNVCTLMSFAADAHKNGASRVTFHRYGDTYFLNSIWDGGSGVGREVIPPHLERELARNRGGHPLTAAILASK